MAHVVQPKAPNLTLPTIEYSESAQNQLQNQLRLSSYYWIARII